MENAKYFVKSVIDGKVIGLFTYDFEPSNLGENTSIISEQEYNDLMLRLQYDESIRFIPEFRILPYYMRYRIESVFDTNSEKLSNSKQITIPVDKTNILLFEYEKFYFNGTYNKTTESFDGLLLIYSNNTEIAVESSKELSIVIDNFKYTITANENGILVNVDLLIKPESYTASYIFLLFRVPAEEGEEI